MVQEDIIIFLRFFFITILILQLAFFIHRIYFWLSKNRNVAHYSYICYFPSFFLSLISNFFYIASEITGWRGISNCLSFGLILMMVFDIVALVYFIVLSKKLYEVHIFYLPQKRKIIDIEKSFIVLHSFTRKREVICLNQINASKSEVVCQKVPTMLEHFYDKTYTHLVLNDGTERKINVGAFINDAKISLLDITHFLKIPLNYRQN